LDAAGDANARVGADDAKILAIPDMVTPAAAAATMKSRRVILPSCNRLIKLVSIGSIFSPPF
jgi:hypothetical protein